jgi:DNA-binding MarR family transcriptional regulator
MTIRTVLPFRAFQVLKFMETTGSITAREAMLDLDMTSATLARRICDLEARGATILRIRKNHPANGRQYTRYVLLQGVA